MVGLHEDTDELIRFCDRKVKGQGHDEKVRKAL